MKANRLLRFLYRYNQCTIYLKGGCCVAMKMIEVDDGNGNKAEIHRYGAATEEDILFKDFPCGETVIYVTLIFLIHS